MIYGWVHYLILPPSGTTGSLLYNSVTDLEVCKIKSFRGSDCNLYRASCSTPLLQTVLIISSRAVEPAILATTHCATFISEHSRNLLFVLSGSWDIKGGACETDPAGNWRAGGSAVADTPRHGKLPFTQEGVWGANCHTPHVCERLWEARHHAALHRRSSPVLCPSSGCRCPWWSTDTRSTWQYPESFSAFFICFYDPYDFLVLFFSCMRQTFLPFLLLLTISFFLSFFFSRSAFKAKRCYLQKTLLLSHGNNVKRTNFKMRIKKKKHLKCIVDLY